MSTLKLKIIKSKEFTVNNDSATHYTLAYKGRVFSLNTLRWSDDIKSITVNGDILTINCDVEVLKNTSTDQLTGEVKTYLDIVPKCGLVLGEF